VQERLDAIERDLAARGPALESAARAWILAKRERERQHATIFMSSDGSVAERNAKADLETAVIGMTDEAEYEAIKAAVRVLETRASIGQSLLRASASYDNVHASVR
jgi:hypothetical protein